MRKPKSNPGFTLIELVLTVAILMVVVVSFLAIFTSGFSTVAKGGNKTTVGFTAQQAAEHIYAGMNLPSVSNYTIETSAPVPSDLTVNLQGDLSSVTASGKVYMVEVDGRDQNLSIDVFVPD